MQPDKPTTRERVARIVEKRPGLTSEEIGVRVGVSGARVRRILATLGYQQGWVPTREVTNGRNSD